MTNEKGREGPLRILIVEDNAGDVRLLREMFKTEPPRSYELMHVARLDLALAQLVEGGVDIVLLDMGLPDGEGIETVRQVRKVAPHVPLIVLTGRDDDQLVAETMREGAQDYLVKGQIETRALPRALRHAAERFALVNEIASANVELERRVKEKDILLAEIHHRVKNNLQVISSLLSMEARRAVDESTVSMLRGTQQRVLTMSAVHQTLYESNDFAQVDFSAFIRSFVPSLIQIYSTRRDQIALVMTIAEGGLPIDLAIPCGLIVNELVSNALKYAFPEGRNGTIRVGFARQQGQDAALSVEDDGIGLPEGFSFKGRRTLGMQLVQMLSRQLGGTIAFDRADPTRFQIQFPLALNALS